MKALTCAACDEQPVDMFLQFQGLDDLLPVPGIIVKLTMELEPVRNVLVFAELFLHLLTLLSTIQYFLLNCREYVNVMNCMWLSRKDHRLKRRQSVNRIGLSGLNISKTIYCFCSSLFQ